MKLSVYILIAMNILLAGCGSDGITKEKACELARSKVIDSGALYARDIKGECSRFESNADGAQICVGTTFVLLHRYPEEGWKAIGQYLGGSCNK